MTLRGLLVLILELILVILAFGTDFKNFLIIGSVIFFFFFKFFGHAEWLAES